MHLIGGISTHRMRLLSGVGIGYPGSQLENERCNQRRFVVDQGSAFVR